MSNLIDRAAVIDALGERPMLWINNDEYTLGARNQYDMDRLAIETVPSIDAVPVVHGRWIFGKDDETGERDVYAWACSVCGEKYPWRPHYCPNCGADMRDGRGVFANG